ncbi:MAG: hypothetical protein HKN40_13245 [Winogradskyella sp.]|uniref:hypothetical protein n=1 Tax=Winogradskyella sp. TaxID=1883156 RepID=UPI0017F47C30|nr:hypothetical protein [Winogradskyella sp.]
MAKKKTTPAVQPKKPILQRLFPSRKKPIRRPEEKFTYLVKELPLLKVTAAVLLYQGGKILLNELNDSSDDPIDTKLTTVIPKNIPIPITKFFDSTVGEWKDLEFFSDNLTYVQKGTEIPIPIAPTDSFPVMLRLMSPNKIAEYLHTVFTGDIYPDDATNQEHCLLMNILFSMIYKYNNAQLRAIYNAFLISYNENLADWLRTETNYLFSDWLITPYERTILAVRSRLGTAGALQKQGKPKKKGNLTAPLLAVAAGVYIVRN